MKLICKGCGTEIKVNSLPGGEILAVSSIMGHIMTCKETQAAAEEKGKGLKEFMKVFFEINEN